jgi:low temperature requirement protein LtrA
MLSVHPSAAELGRYVALFIPILWAWTGFAFYATRFDTDDLVYRLLTLLGMFAVAGVAATVPDALHGGQTGFVVSYVAVRLVLIALYARAYVDVEIARPLARWFMELFGAAVCFWLVSLAVPSPWKYALWVVAMALELVAPPRAWRMIRHAPIHPAHIPERFGLLTIIVLGESVIAVVLGTAEVSWTPSSGAAAFAGFVAAAAIWWLYFGFLDASIVRRSIRAGMTFVYAHFPVTIGIAALGVGVKLAILSVGPGGRFDHVGWLACVGVALCMSGLAVIQLVTPPVLFDLDVWLRIGTAAFAGALAGLSAVLSPVVVLWFLAAVLVAQVAVELASHEDHALEAGPI